MKTTIMLFIGQQQFKEGIADTADKSENGYYHRIYYVTTKDFSQFSKERLMYNPGFNIIDASIYKDNDRYVMLIKDERLDPPQKNPRVAFSKHLTGPYSSPSLPITENYWAEGPIAIKIGNSWLVYFDKYKGRKYGAVRSDNLKIWKDISDQGIFPKGMRHETVFKVSKEILRSFELINSLATVKLSMKVRI